MQRLFSLYILSCWHVLMPGHSKTLLSSAWISNISSKAIWCIAIGYSFSHGLLMGGAVVSGLILKNKISELATNYGFFIRHSYFLILLFFGIYFLIKALKIKQTTISNDKTKYSSNIKTSKALFTGLLLGFIPCSDTIGIALISSALFEMIPNIITAFFIVWLGVITTILSIVLLLTRINISKIKISKKLPEWIPFAGASLICFTASLYKGFILWEEFFQFYF
jgi:ABC-type nickel/cobalt efflux system permease component RcnA